MSLYIFIYIIKSNSEISRMHSLIIIFLCILRRKKNYICMYSNYIQKKIFYINY